MTATAAQIAYIEDLRADRDYYLAPGRPFAKALEVGVEAIIDEFPDVNRNRRIQETTRELINARATADMTREERSALRKAAEKEAIAMRPAQHAAHLTTVLHALTCPLDGLTKDEASTIITTLKCN